MNGFVFMKLWQWFMVPSFGLNPLTLVQAIGIGLMISYTTQDHSWTYVQEKTNEQSLKMLSYEVIKPLAYYVVGCIFYMWFM